MVEKRKLKVGILSDSPFICTGFANQSTYIANMLSKEGHDVIYLGHAYMGQMLVPPITFEDNKVLNFKVLPNEVSDHLALFLEFA